MFAARSVRACARVSVGSQAATHNQQSVEYVIAQMELRGLPPQSPLSGVYFGQLLGMADNLTFLLGAHGYRAYKVWLERACVRLP